MVAQRGEEEKRGGASGGADAPDRGVVEGLAKGVGDEGEEDDPEEADDGDFGQNRQVQQEGRNDGQGEAGNDGGGGAGDHGDPPAGETDEYGVHGEAGGGDKGHQDGKHQGLAPWPEVWGDWMAAAGLMGRGAGLMPNMIAVEGAAHHARRRVDAGGFGGQDASEVGPAKGAHRGPARCG